jgi:hypothetical protein
MEVTNTVSFSLLNYIQLLKLNTKHSQSFSPALSFVATLICANSLLERQTATFVWIQCTSVLAGDGGGTKWWTLIHMLHDTSSVRTTDICTGFPYFSEPLSRRSPCPSLDGGHGQGPLRHPGPSCRPSCRGVIGYNSRAVSLKPPLGTQTASDFFPMQYITL